MDKKRRARKILLVILAVIFVLAAVYYAALLVDMFNDRVYIVYQGELYRAHRRLGSGYELPDDAVEIGKARTVIGGKKMLKEDFDTTLNRDNLTVYLSETHENRLYLLELDSLGQKDVWIFARK